MCTEVSLVTEVRADWLEVLVMSSTEDNLGGQGRGGRDGLCGLPTAEKYFFIYNY